MTNIRVRSQESGVRRDELIRCEGVWKIYNEGRPHEVQALADVSLEIKKGSFTILNGPSGSGKTTLLALLGTMDRPSRGGIFMKGKDITGFSDTALSTLRRDSIGFVFQNFNLIPRLSAWENVSTPLIPAGVSEKGRRDRAMVLLEKLGLADRASHAPEELSGGEQQRVAIARALINNPEIIILDEPTSNIDAEATDILIDILKNLKSDSKTLLVSTHDQVLRPHADTVFELKRGRLAGITHD
ncbi:MAG: ABC transporter ATP-binding protein [Nitrospirae bacterium]|nr:ABC transporter ATP-binding protein [Nitrospirota bacterium]